MQYLAPLDGLRALAIIAVLAFHIAPTSLKGGFAGVDVFFVLSGFLITSILIHDLRTGEFSIREFYLRRIQRLLPNLIATVFVVLLIGNFLLPPSSAISFGQHGLWTLFSASNIYINRHIGGYWSDTAEGSPLTHTWSLGIEEQFYLLFPFFLVLLFRIKLKDIRWILAGLTVLSFGLCLSRIQAEPVDTFYSLPTRVWELLLGATLAAHRSPQRGEGTPRALFQSRLSREFSGWIGLVLVVAGLITIDESYVFPGVIALVPTLGTLLLIASVSDGDSTIGRIFSHRLLVAIGALSYSLYLWHWPMITFGKVLADRYDWSRSSGAALGGLAGIVAGIAAYYLVERPFRSRGTGRGRRLLTIASALIAVACYAWHSSGRIRESDPYHRFDPVSFSSPLYEAGHIWDQFDSTSTPYYDVRFPDVPPRPNDLWRTGGVIHRYGNGDPKVVVLGSSHALMYSRTIDEICREYGLSVAFLAVGAGTPAFFETRERQGFDTREEAHEFDETRKRWLRDWHPELVFVIDRWDCRAEARPELFDVKLRTFLDQVSPLTERIAFVTQVPVFKCGKRFNVREYIAWNGKAEIDGDGPRLTPDSKDPYRKRIAELAESATNDYPKLRVIRADREFYRDDGSIRYASGRKCFYMDDDHLSDAGSDSVRALFERAIVDTTSGILRLK